MVKKIAFSLLFISMLLPYGVSFAGNDQMNEDLNNPYSIVVGENQIYISDTDNHRIRTITKNGEIRTFAGTTVESDEENQPIGGYRDGNGVNAMFLYPKGLVMDTDYNLYVADTGNGAIRKITTTGMVSTVVTGLQSPTDLAITDNGVLYVSDPSIHQILKISSDGEVNPFAGGGYEEEEDGQFIGDYQDGIGIEAKFNQPTGIAIDKNGTLYVSDTGNHAIRKVTSTGVVTTIKSTKNDINFHSPHGVYVTADQNILIADTKSNRVRKITSNGQVENVIGINQQINDKNDKQLTSRFNQPMDVAQTKDGHIIILDESITLIAEALGVDENWNVSNQTLILPKVTKE